MSTKLLKQYQAAMVLSGVGDALGYRNGRWEFCHSGKTIHKELELHGGLEKIDVRVPGWRVSDDTVMHLATADALVEWGRESETNDKDRLFSLLAKYYITCMNDMDGRAPGITCMGNVGKLDPKKPKGFQIPFNPRGGGCGAAMRAMCIGLRFPSPEDIEDLVAVSVESGRMTHHHPTGFLGSFAAALFVSYSLQGKPLNQWGADMLSRLPLCLEYIKKSGHCIEENTMAWRQEYFKSSWTKYLKMRGILDGRSDPVFPDDYDVEERDKFVTSVSFDGWGGASGHDAPMIAYDALLGAGNHWAELCSRSMFHCGDSDSTGVIAAACYGAMNGFSGVPDNLYQNLEYKDRLLKAGKAIYLLSHDGEDAMVQEDFSSDKDSLGPPPDSGNLVQLQELVKESVVDTNSLNKESSVSTESPCLGAESSQSHDPMDNSELSNPEGELSQSNDPGTEHQGDKIPQDTEIGTDSATMGTDI